MPEPAVLVTRPEPGASATAAKLAAGGFAPLLAPCLAIVARRPRLAGPVGAIALTSAQAIPFLPRHFAQTPVFAVGDATAGKARAAGFHRVVSAAGTAADLARLMLREDAPEPILWPTGAGRPDTGQGAALARALRAGGKSVLRRTVYAAEPATSLPEAVRAALAAGDVAYALFYSAETARAFLALDPPATDKIVACGLSETVAGALRTAPWAGIRVAPYPTEADLLALLA